jgi:hypothetical protein
MALFIAEGVSGFYLIYLKLLHLITQATHLLIIVNSSQEIYANVDTMDDR